MGNSDFETRKEYLQWDTVRLYVWTCAGAGYFFMLTLTADITIDGDTATRTSLE
jgi:hypothetical protein